MDQATLQEVRGETEKEGSEGVQSESSTSKDVFWIVSEHERVDKGKKTVCTPASEERNERIRVGSSLSTEAQTRRDESIDES